MAISSVVILEHTTASSPRPHVVYFVDVTTSDGGQKKVSKRSRLPWQFLELQTILGDNETLPPKRILVTSFLPSAWVDDKLIAERKAGLSQYLNNLLKSPRFGSSRALTEFLSASSGPSATGLSLEDALPSTLSRKAALEAQATIAAASPIAAAYYPDWSADSRPPENLDFSKFDITQLHSIRHAELFGRYQLGQRVSVDLEEAGD